MKYIYKISIFCAVLMLSFSSCDKDFLQKTPLDQGSVEGFFETSEDVVRAINGIYDVFQGDIWGGAFYWYNHNFDILTDNGVGCCPWEGQFSTIAEGTHNAGTGGIINNKWDFGYEGIFRANSVLENIGNVNLDPATETLYIAEVRFLRSLIYQEMVNLFGDVPLVLKVLTREEGLAATRTPKSEVLAQIYSDLDFAEANLGTTPTNGDIGRPTKQSAIAVKARLKMYNKDWAGAAAEAKKIMDMSAANPDLIGLVDNYADVFSPTNENNKEVLFDVQFTGGTQGEGNYLQVALAPGPEGTPGSGWGSNTPTDQLANAFYMKDGLPSDESPLFDADNPYENREERLYANLLIPGVSMWRGKVFDSALSGFSPFFAIRKWVDPAATIGEDGCSCNETNLILYRYADILMIYAESMNELNGPTEDVYAALNQVVTRAGLPAIESGLSKDEMREVIHHERHVEFPWEGTRYFDLIRWGKAADIIPIVTLFGESLDDRVFDPAKHTLWPIPQKELDLNPNLTQNPGY
ncbi:RagB/SusD family nutrient uptake outer membrane protein [Portibacter lacus]|uniref:Membrane protein n=1 Tax=Portibacter lacus TaxID=1099794 RepID=A0AA37SU10_9BACT|nr:RagB/SusD family nutrient uptake outer membrane protein [Portibacter lacus]GLR19669.1 membrane protein [Portibacter lacus]